MISALTMSPIQYSILAERLPLAAHDFEVYLGLISFEAIFISSKLTSTTEIYGLRWLP